MEHLGLVTLTHGKVKYRPSGFKKVEAPRFQDNWCMKVARLSALCTSHLYPPGNILVLIVVTGWVNPRATVWLEEFCQWKIPMTPSGMEPMTFQLVVQCLKKVCHQVPSYYMVATNKYFNLRMTKLQGM